MRTVFFDVDTQIDFLLPAGALYVLGAEAIIPTIAHLAHFAAHHSIPIISTMDAHSEDDPEFKIWKPHCVTGTAGQLKPLSTLLPQSYSVPSSPAPADNLLANVGTASQILLQKQHTDCFTNPNLKPLLRALGSELYIVYGVVTEICVQQAVLGLLSLGAQVRVVTDAVRSLNRAEADRFFLNLSERGVTLTTAGAVIASGSEQG